MCVSSTNERTIVAEGDRGEVRDGLGVPRWKWFVASYERQRMHVPPQLHIYTPCDPSCGLMLNIAVRCGSQSSGHGFPAQGRPATLLLKLLPNKDKLELKPQVRTSAGTVYFFYCPQRSMIVVHGSSRPKATKGSVPCHQSANSSISSGYAD